MTGKTVLYRRVSTTDQSLVHQRTSEYATDRLGIEVPSIELYSDKQTGTDTDHDGYRELMEAGEAGKIKLIIASGVSRISRSVRGFVATLEHTVGENRPARALRSLVPTVP